MKTIWKYQLRVTDQQDLEVPKGAEFLSLQLQHGVPCAWFLVEDEAAKETLRLWTFGTGHEAHRATESYLGTYQFNQGNHIFHVFLEKLS